MTSMVGKADTYRKAITSDDFSRLMKNETFVDFFNVFLSLPTFSQRLLYRVDNKDFEFDPPISRRNQKLEKTRLVDWLLENRLPYFLQSEFYLEFLLCEQLMALQPHLSDSSHNIDYEEFRLLEDKDLLKTAIGHVIGMCHFRAFMQGTPGEKVVEFWKDAERFNRLPMDRRAMRKAFFREMQLKYFQPEGMIQLTDNNLWQALNDAAYATDIDLSDPKGKPPMSLAALQTSVLTLLKHYWLQRYLIHHMALSKKVPPPPDDACKLRSLSDLRVLQDIKNIDKALKLAQGETNPDLRTRDITAKLNWRAMFPHAELDDDILTSLDDVVTLHGDKEVTIENVGSEFDTMLQRYLYDSSDSSSEEEIEIEGGWENSRVKTPIDDGPERRGRTERKQEEEQRKWELAPMASLSSLRGTPSPQKEVSATEATSSLVKHIADIEAERHQLKKLTVDNLALFEQLITVDSEGNPVTPDHMSARPTDYRPQTSLRENPPVNTSSQTSSLHKDIKLPFLRPRQGAVGADKRPSTCRLPSIEMRKSESRCFMKKDPLPAVDYKYVNFSSGNYRYDNKVFVSSLASDLVCGRPFLAYLLRYKHHQAAASLRLWAEIHTYLSLRPTVNPADDSNGKQAPADTAHRVRFWRAHKMIVRYLTPDQKAITKEVNQRRVVLPPGVAEILRETLIYGTADDMLQKVQDHICQGLHELWKSFVYLDKDRFLTTALCPKASVQPHGYRGVPRIPSIERARNCLQTPLPPLAQATPPRGPPGNKGASPKPGTEVNGKGHNGKISKRRHTKGKVATQSPEGNQSATDKPDQAASQKKTSEKAASDSPGGGATKRETSITDELFVIQEEHKGLMERRMWRALQLVAFVSNIDIEQLLVEPLCFEGLEHNSDERAGSLSLKKLVVKRRRDLIEAEERKRKAQAQAYTRQMAALKAIAVEQLPPEVLDENVPEWAKPFRGENGRWVYRHVRPKTFADIFKDPYRIEFFKRFLKAHGDVAQLNFWIEVDSMKRAKDSTYRQQKINQILRRYFISPKGFASLNCNDEVIKEIPKMEKVTPAMLISGQSCISKLIEEKWFSVYQATFPEPEHDEDEASAEEKEVRRKWTTERSRAYWMSFVRLVVRFRQALLDKEMTKEFGNYLKQEIVRETEKQRAAGTTYVPGLPIKKVIRNRLIDITKLLNDLAFLAETEKFRMLCDNAAEAARQGIYRTDDQHLLDRKAKTIIMCFMDSEIPPRIQINSSSDTVDNICATFQSGLVDRGLFHHATLAIFPVVAYMWKKFRKMRFIEMFGFKTKEDIKEVVLERSPTVNFMDLSQADGRKIISVHEDDHPRILFSLSGGLRIITPPTREQMIRRALDAARSAGERANLGTPTGQPSVRGMTLAVLGNPHLKTQSPEGRRRSRAAGDGGRRASVIEGSRVLSLVNGSDSSLSSSDDYQPRRRDAMIGEVANDYTSQRRGAFLIKSSNAKL